MENREIQIGEIEIHSRAGEGFTFEGVFSNKALSGINLKLENVDKYNQEKIENLLKEKEIDIYDPFSAREYKGTITQKSNSFTVGREVKSYEITVKEIDQIPYFEEIELNGVCFSVLSYEESITSNTVSRQGVVKLTKDQFEKFRELLSVKSLEVRRVGVDEKPFEMRFGSQMFWSVHDEDETTYFKHIFRLFDTTLDSNGMDLGSGVIQRNAANMLIDLTSKFESLVEVLKADSSLSDDTKNKLLDINSNELSSKELIGKLYDRLEKVIDVNKHFK